MATVHVFFSTGRFHSLGEIRTFVDPTYNADGDCIPSIFMREVGLASYEPACIEIVFAGQRTPLCELLAQTSYANQWVPKLDLSIPADAAICVFEPNVVNEPRRSSLEYAGAFHYQVVFPEWFQRLIRGE